MGRKKNSKKSQYFNQRTARHASSSEASDINQDSTQNDLQKPSPITASKRLTYSLVRCTRKSLTPDSDDEDTIEFDIRPRRVFIANACLLCIQLCGSQGIPCDSCQMVFYCKEEHKRQNLSSHRDLCKILCDTRTKDKIESLADDTSADEYRIFRVELIRSIEERSKRTMDLWEREVLLYPRVCLKCHRFGEDLKICPDCKIVFFCQNHEGDHRYWCLQYQIFYKIVLMQNLYGNVDPVVPDVLLKETFELPVNFDDLMTKFYGRSLYFLKMDSYTYATLSHIATIPLTTLFALQKSQSDWRNIKTHTIHIVGAEFQFEGSNLHVWEKLFLHFLPNMKSLSIIVTGPELFVPNVPPELLSKIRMCSSCKSAGRKINVSFVPNKMYHEFCKSIDYVEPDMICLFNPGLYRSTGYNGQDTWPQTIVELCNARVPLTVTAYTEHEIPKDVLRIKSICDVDVVLDPQRNPFASLKPDRNFVSDDTVPLIYKNYYISIVRQVR